MVRARRADGGDESPVHADGRDPRTGGVDQGERPQAAPPARRGQLLLPAAGEDGPEPRPLRAQLRRPLDRAARPHARRFQLPALPGRSGAPRMVYRGCDGAGAAAGHGGRQQGHQRSHPLHPRRQPLDRADAGRAERLRGLRLHLRHRPGGRVGQGAGRMGDRRGDGMGHVVGRPAPLHRPCRRPGLRARQGEGGVRPRIRHPLPPPRMARGAEHEDVACPREDRGDGRPDGGL